MSSLPGSEVSLAESSMPILNVPSQSTGTEGHKFTIFDVEKTFVRKGGLHSTITLDRFPEDNAETLPDTYRRYRLVKADAEANSAVEMSISNVASLPASYAEVPVNPWSCSIMTGFTPGWTHQVDAVFLHNGHDKGTFLHDVPFVVTELGVPHPLQSVSMANNYLTRDSSNAISDAGGFVLRTADMDDIQMSSSQDKITPRLMVTGKDAQPLFGTELLRMSSAKVSAVEGGTKVFEGVTEWSQSIDGSSEPFKFQCHLEPAAWIA